MHILKHTVLAFKNVYQKNPIVSHFLENYRMDDDTNTLIPMRAKV